MKDHDEVVTFTVNKDIGRNRKKIVTVEGGQKLESVVKDWDQNTGTYWQGYEVEDTGVVGKGKKIN